MEVIIKGLSKVFTDKKGNEVRAVDKMDLVIPSGKLIGLLGPSGCGKSTTLYMIAGLHKATEGEIFFGETPVSNVPPEKRGIGLVFQNYALYPHLTVRKNISFPLENLRPKMTREEKELVVLEMAKLVDIEKYLDRKPKELSGGQQQRVAIARAMSKKPQVLLLDEPLSNLDARLRLQTREEIKRIQKETKVTTVFVTHDQEEAMSISDEIVVMSQGVIQQVGEPQYVYENPTNLFVAKFLGTPAINIFDGVIANGKLYINSSDRDSFDSGYTGEDRKVKIGIRPENFTLGDKGDNIVRVDVSMIEHIGRDISLIGNITKQESKVRIIIPSEQRSKVNEKQLKFNAKKFFVFEEDGERIK